MHVPVLCWCKTCFCIVDSGSFSEYSSGNVFSGLATAAKLLGCTANQLVTAMSIRKIRAGNDNIVKKLTLTQVCNYLIFNGFLLLIGPLGFYLTF
jgi:myosin V